DERVSQLVARSGEATQDQGSLTIGARSHILLGDQIHAVVERSHEAEMRRAVIRLNFIMAVLALEEHDGLPLAFLEAAIDARGLFFDFDHEVLIALDAGAAGSADLHESELAAIDGMLFEEPLDAAKTLGN